MKITEFTSTTARETSDKIQRLLAELEDTLGVSITTEGGSFSPDTFTLKLKCQIVSESGERVVADSTHRSSNAWATAHGLSYDGNFIGSRWYVKGETLQVTEIVTKRRKYPISLLRSDGARSKCGADFLRLGVPLTKPTEEEFVTWFTVDPDEDSVCQKDEVVCDRVQKVMDELPEGRHLDEMWESIERFTDGSRALHIMTTTAKKMYAPIFAGDYKQVIKILGGL